MMYLFRPKWTMVATEALWDLTPHGQLPSDEQVVTYLREVKQAVTIADLITNFDMLHPPMVGGLSGVLTRTAANHGMAFDGVYHWRPPNTRKLHTRYVFILGEWSKEARSDLHLRLSTAMAWHISNKKCSVAEWVAPWENETKSSI